ncbi:MAG: hypothetical protein JO204_20310 [Alphaproteobacteria bacterium]|nr:hypothetical protein [Alphaproteobacteria bacterium]
MPPLASTIPPPLSGPWTIPDPIIIAPLPIVSPDVSVRLPPSSLIVPFVMLSAALIVREPLGPISSV